MSCTHADPSTTIAPGDPLGQYHALMVSHTSEAEAIIAAALDGGLSRSEALAKAARPIRAAQRARALHLVELPHMGVA